MERAELAAGSLDVRGSGAIHRFLSLLGDFFLGIAPGAHREKENENWWDRDDPAARAEAAPTIAFGRQTELFDETGQVAYAPAERAGAPTAETAAAAAKVAGLAVPQTIVSVQSRSRHSARVVATTRAALAAVRVAAVPKTAAAARGEVARQLIASQSISSGREESRWFSVPQRVLLPRYQLFEGAESVTEDAGGGLCLASRSTRMQRGHVWFV